MANRSDTNSPEAIHDLIGASYALAHGPARIALLEEAVARADALNDDILGYEARQKLVESAMFGGRPDMVLVAFSWCVAAFDRNPELFDSYTFLWHWKWIPATLAGFPQIERSTIEKMLNDMEKRFLAYGATLQPVWKKRSYVAQMLGDMDFARIAFRKFTRMARTVLSDCQACEADAIGEFYFDTDRYALGLKKLATIFDGSMTCAEVPHRTYARALLPMVRVGSLDEALHSHRRGYPMIQRNPQFASYCSMHAAYLALTGDDAKALRLIERHMNDACDTCDPHREYTFMRHVWLALDLISERRKKAKLRLPQLSETIHGPDEYALPALADALRERGLELAKQFDKRNGNDFYSQSVLSMPKWKKFAVRKK